MAWFKRNFLGDDIPQESVNYTCIACITIDFVMKMERKNYPQVYLEKYKYNLKKIKMSKFINANLESGSESELELKSDTELESNSELQPETE